MPEFFTTISQRKEFDKIMKQKIDKLVNLSDLATNRDREAAIKIQRSWRRTKTPEHKSTEPQQSVEKHETLQP